MSKYAKVIVDISHENVDRAFDYQIPEELEAQIKEGTQVVIPFGKSNRQINGFVVGISDKTAYDSAKIKSITSVLEGSVSLESSLIELAYFIKTNYGSTMNRALKTVLPAKKTAKPEIKKYICLACSDEELKKEKEKCAKSKRSGARLRLLSELENEKTLPYSIVKDKLNISQATLNSLEKAGFIKIDIEENLRNALNTQIKQEYKIKLTNAQQAVSDDIFKRYKEGDKRPSLIRGITGSGKTEVYIDIIDRFVKEGKQAIVLIPEIALTYQTVLRFYKKFGERISVINSKLTYAQKHDQLEKARKGEVDIIIGPRSALFAPFEKLGIIVIDEEHEPTYTNENVPRYHAREVAEECARLCGGIVVLGSATPSVESYSKALNNDYKLYELEARAGGSRLPKVEIVDLRQELEEGNRSIISRRLDELIKDRISKKEQVMLFINRRGYSSFVSCRSCGTALKCPHCDVSLKYHKNGMLMCHYCGYVVPMVKNCPSCGSKYIGTFGTGTQKVEEELKQRYPEAEVLRMDFDTTRSRTGYEKILSAFANNEADILVGTQMIVKGHDFANVTLVGILAADMSLYSGDYKASERTFELLTQAAGRAGRAEKPGEVVIQTYSPDNYAIYMGAAQDYKSFYEREMDFRRLLGYPPAMNMLGILFSSEDEKHLFEQCKIISELMDKNLPEKTVKIGPSNAPIGRINDRYRKVIYVKSEKYTDLTGIKDIIEKYYEENPDKKLMITFDFSMMGGLR